MTMTSYALGTPYLDPRLRERAPLLEPVRQLHGAGTRRWRSLAFSQSTRKMELCASYSTADLPTDSAGHHRFSTWPPSALCGVAWSPTADELLWPCLVVLPMGWSWSLFFLPGSAGAIRSTSTRSGPTGSTTGPPPRSQGRPDARGGSVCAWVYDNARARHHTKEPERSNLHLTSCG